MQGVGSVARAFAILVLVPLAMLYAWASEPFTKLGVVLLQPSSVLEERVASVDAMAEYIKSIEAASREAVLASQLKQSASGFIVVAVRPGQVSKVWLDFDTLLNLETSRQMVAKITAVKPFEAHQGPVVFALKVALWDGRESKRVAPSPAEWKAATKKAGRPLDIDSLVENVWH
jgi:hypothetical protein